MQAVSSSDKQAKSNLEEHAIQNSYKNKAKLCRNGTITAIYQGLIKVTK